ncbi:site-specific integrase [Bradyrhizobium ottawaense]|uniref:site-specific integrase n=1 Tax=Bradyrhizobium ottawaense TaxID=931866 RepID=UPI0015CF208A|nr:site-specific integrase [Bradyrhizobium ottawaense]
MIAEVLAAYGNEVAPDKPSARNIGYHISNLLKWWGEKRVSDVSIKSCKEYVKTKTAAGAWGDLKVLKAAVKYWHGEYGPLDAQPLFWKPELNPPKERWLTRSEAARLLWAARRYQHLRRMILLGLYTGSRPGVLLSLTWAQVDLKAGVMSRTPEGKTQDKKKRAPKVRLGRRITAHLKRWKRLDGAQRLVCYFTSPHHPGARQVEDPHGAWRKVIEASELKGVTKHTLRHTRATWMMQAGVPIWEAAGFLGMSVKTLERVYGHHSPDHQENAANI